MMGMALRWSGVGSTKPAARTPLTRIGGNPSVANGTEPPRRSESVAMIGLVSVTNGWGVEPGSLRAGFPTGNRESGAARRKALAARTIERGALALDDAANRAAAAATGLAGPIVDQQSLAKIARLVP